MKRLDEELQALKDKVALEGEEIVANSLPNKVLALHRSFLATQSQRIQGRCGSEESGGSRSQIAEYRDNKSLVVPVNKVVTEAIHMLKKDIVAMLHEIAALKLWIRLRVPQIEDGNTFGVEVQNEVLGMLSSLYSSGQGFLQSLSGYFSKRAKLVADMRKRPWVKEYGQAMYDLDDKQFINLVQSCCDLRNNYAFLHDKIIKNKEKIIRPKGNSSHRDNSMY
jgi:hypothetical protein